MRPITICARLGATKQEVQGTLRPAAACSEIVDLQEILGKSTAQAEAGHLCRKASGRGLAGCVSWVGQGLGITRARKTVLARLMESTDLTPTCPRSPGWREGSAKDQWHLPALLSPERAVLTSAPLASLLKLVDLVPPCVSLVLFELLSCFGAQRE